MYSKVWIKGDELKILHDIFNDNGWTVPDDKATAVVAIDESGIAAFHVLQMRPHPEPLYVRPDMRGSKIALDLATDMKQFLDSVGAHGFIVIADDPTAVKLCESFGMRKVTSPVYVRDGL